MIKGGRGKGFTLPHPSMVYNLKNQYHVLCNNRCGHAVLDILSSRPNTIVNWNLQVIGQLAEHTTHICTKGTKLSSYIIQHKCAF